MLRANLKYFFEEILELDYVVQRNWEELPFVSENDDVDLFVSEENKEIVEIAVRRCHAKIDIRSIGDGYYPNEICEMLLKNKRGEKGFYIPSKEAYFISLFYHAHVQKKENKYQEELKRAFLDWIPPTRPKDEGVGYFI